MKIKKNKKEKVLSFLFITVAAFLFAGPNLVQARNVEDKVKQTIDQIADKLKQEVDQLGEDYQKIQDYLGNYDWQGLIKDKVRSGPVTIKDLRLNGKGCIVAVKRGASIDGKVTCKFHHDQFSSAVSRYQVVLGLKEYGPQTVIGGPEGLIGGHSHHDFTLQAPNEPGLYELRFRVAEAYLESTALREWRDAAGNEPDATATIGLIYVK